MWICMGMYVVGGVVAGSLSHLAKNAWEQVVDSRSKLNATVHCFCFRSVDQLCQLRTKRFLKSFIVFVITLCSLPYCPIFFCVLKHHRRRYTSPTQTRASFIMDYPRWPTFIEGFLTNFCSPMTVSNFAEVRLILKRARRLAKSTITKLDETCLLYTSPSPRD